jgi:hypothetical protein
MNTHFENGMGHAQARMAMMLRPDVANLNTARSAPCPWCVHASFGICQFEPGERGNDYFTSI